MELKFDEKGLIPAIVQDHYTKEVLTLAYMNAETLALTIAEGRTVFWSRSRQEIWRKGDTSGNVQHVVSITADCDKDALVVEVSVTGDQAAMPVVSGTPVLNVSFNSVDSSKSLYYDGNKFSSVNDDVINLLRNCGIEVTILGNYKFQLRMTDASIQNLELSRGTWEIVLNGSNELEGKGKDFSGCGLRINDYASATIKAEPESASLTVKNSPTKRTSKDASSAIVVAGSLTIESGTIEAAAYAEQNSDPVSGAIVVQSKGTLNIRGGSVTAAGTHKNGVYVLNNFQMTCKSIKKKC